MKRAVGILVVSMFGIATLFASGAKDAGTAQPKGKVKVG
jgi:hypothetical protein